MSLLWIILLSALALVWVLSIVDIFRRHDPSWTTVGWLALVVVLPFAGSLIYWAARKPTREDAEQEYLAEADLRHDRAGRPFDSTSIGLSRRQRGRAAGADRRRAGRERRCRFIATSRPRRSPAVALGQGDGSTEADRRHTISSKTTSHRSTTRHCSAFASSAGQASTGAIGGRYAGTPRGARSRSPPHRPPPTS